MKTHGCFIPLVCLVIITVINIAAGGIDPSFQQLCRRTFQEISSSEALSFLGNGKRETPRGCCEEGPCEHVFKQRCNTEQFRSLILGHYTRWTCPPGQSVRIKQWCIGHIEHDCTDPCSALNVSRCVNGGTCVPNGASWKCICRQGYHGVICQIDIDECVTNHPCNASNTVNCENTPGSYRCHCKPGYTGKDCEIEVDECASRPCQHSGTCTDRVNRFECTCKPGYTGTVCEIDIDECASSPCQNGATCVDHVNFFRCRCAPGFYGTLCDTNICRPLPADVVFVLDSSISMTESQFKKQLEFVSNFTDEIRLGPRDFQMSVITYSSEAHIEFYLDAYRDNVTMKEAIANITYEPGATFTHLALEKVKTVFDPGHGGHVPRYNNTLADRFVYLMTDGMSNNRRLTANVARELRDRLGITMSAIGIGNQVSHEELVQIASKTGSQRDMPSVYSVNNFNSLYTVLKQLVHVTCKECTRSKKSDVIIIMDASASMTDEQFQTSKNALIYIVGELDLGVNETQLSIITFDSAINERYSFGDFKNKHDINSLINSVPKAFGTPKVDVSDVINDVKDNILPKGRAGARSFFLFATNGDFGRSDNETSSLKNEKTLTVDGVETIVMGTGDDIVFEGLLELASDPFNVYIADNPDSFSTLDVIKTYFEYSVCDLQ